MKKQLLIVGLLFIVTGMISTTSAQKRGGMKQMYSRTYDISTVETIEGEIVEVSYNPSRKNRATMGVHVMLKTDAESIPVHLGPVWYMSEQEALEKGDKIEVTGSRISYNGAPALIAATVKRNEMTLRLRDQNGFPVWRGWRKGSINRR